MAKKMPKDRYKVESQEPKAFEAKERAARSGPHFQPNNPGIDRTVKSGLATPGAPALHTLPGGLRSPGKSRR